jgi:hypothetical protein
VAEYSVAGLSTSLVTSKSLDNIDTVRVTSTSIVMRKTLTFALMGMIALTALSVLALQLIAYEYLALKTLALELETLTAATIYQHLDTQEKLFKAAAQVFATYAILQQYVGKIGLTIDEIKDLPIFFVFQSLTHDIYENDLNTIASQPWLAVLQYVGAENSSITDENRKAACAGKDYLRTSKRPQLDEYPFASTYQGGACSSVVPVSVAEHTIQRVHLSAFYRSKLKGQSGWFLVVPLPF